MYLIKTFNPRLNMGKKHDGGQDIFIYLGYILLNNGNIILRKYGKNMKTAVRPHTHVNE